MLKYILRLYFRLKYKLPKTWKNIWFAGYYVGGEKYPPYRDSNGRYIYYKIDDSVPVKLLPNGKLAIYKITGIQRARFGDDSAGWDDNRHYDLEFVKIIKQKGR